MLPQAVTRVPRTSSEFVVYFAFLVLDITYHICYSVDCYFVSHPDFRAQ